MAVICHAGHMGDSYNVSHYRIGLNGRKRGACAPRDFLGELTWLGPHLVLLKFLSAWKLTATHAPSSKLTHLIWRATVKKKIPGSPPGFFLRPAGRVILNGNIKQRPGRPSRMQSGQGC